MYRSMKPVILCLLTALFLAACAAPAAAPPAAAPNAAAGARDMTAAAAPAEAAEPVFDTVIASSVTVSTRGRDYSPGLVADGKPETVWSYTGTSGEWILLSAGSAQTVRGIRVLSGYTMLNPETKLWHYYPNNRPKDILLTFSDGSYMETTLADVFGTDTPYYQDIRFDAPKQTTFIKLTVLSVYPGDRWNDTCIAEIQPYLNAGADTPPTPTPTSAPAPEASGREKLWDDGIYVTAKRNGDYDAMQRLVYDNYGNVVGQYYDFFETDRIMLNVKADLIMCQDYKGMFNIFSYEKLDYVIDDTYPISAKPRLPGAQPNREWDWELRGSVLTFTEDGIEQSYTLPISGGTHQISAINDTMVYVDDSLILYQSGTILRSRKSDPSTYWHPHLNEGYAIMTEWQADERLYRFTVIDKDGKTLWQGDWKEVYIDAERYEEESAFEVINGALTLRTGGESYRVNILDPADAQDIYVSGLNANVAYIVQPNGRDRLVRYKTGEDLSALLQYRYDAEFNYSPTVIIFRDYIVIQYYDPKSDHGYAILDGNGNLISQGDGYLYYVGHDLFELRRGNYFGVVNARGEWLLRLLRIGED